MSTLEREIQLRLMRTYKGWKTIGKTTKWCVGAVLQWELGSFRVLNYTRNTLNAFGLTIMTQARDATETRSTSKTGKRGSASIAATPSTRAATLPETRLVAVAGATAIAKAIFTKKALRATGNGLRYNASELIARLTPGLTEAVSIVMRGKEIRITEDDPLLTTQKAADLLGVSRPHIVKLLDENEIAAAPKKGNQRRVFRSAVLNYKRANAKMRRESLAELTVFSQSAKMGY